jgi:hypothetical protein
MYLEVGRTAEGRSLVGYTIWSQYINAYYAGNSKSLNAVDKTSKSHSNVPSSESQPYCVSGIGPIVPSDKLRESSDTLAMAGRLLRTGLRASLGGDEVGGKGACRECLGDAVAISNQSPCANKDYRASRWKMADAGEREVGAGHHALFRYERDSRTKTSNTRWVCLLTIHSALAVLTDTSLTCVQHLS